MSARRSDPDAPLLFHDGRWWEPKEVPGWIMLGFCREPVGARSTFRYHVLHGLLSGLPIRAVLAWSWRHRKSFAPAPDHAETDRGQG